MRTRICFPCFANHVLHVKTSWSYYIQGFQSSPSEVLRNAIGRLVEVCKSTFSHVCLRPLLFFSLSEEILTNITRGISTH